jgi:hypothetical protein
MGACSSKQPVESRDCKTHVDRRSSSSSSSNYSIANTSKFWRLPEVKAPFGDLKLDDEVWIRCQKKKKKVTNRNVAMDQSDKSVGYIIGRVSRPGGILNPLIEVTMSPEELNRERFNLLREVMKHWPIAVAHAIHNQFLTFTKSGDPITEQSYKSAVTYGAMSTSSATSPSSQSAMSVEAKSLLDFDRSCGRNAFQVFEKYKRTWDEVQPWVITIGSVTGSNKPILYQISEIGLFGVSKQFDGMLAHDLTPLSIRYRRIFTPAVGADIDLSKKKQQQQQQTPRLTFRSSK